MLNMGKLFWWKQFTPLASASSPKFLRTTIISPALERKMSKRRLNQCQKPLNTLKEP